MQILIGLLLVVYGVVAPVLFFTWVELMRRDRPVSRRERLLSRCVVLIATALWPIVLPLTYLELLERTQSSKILPKADLRVL
jgi:hypothetical protein